MLFHNSIIFIVQVSCYFIKINLLQSRNFVLHKNISQFQFAKKYFVSFSFRKVICSDLMPGKLNLFTAK